MSKLKKKIGEVTSFVEVIAREYLLDDELREANEEKRSEKRVNITLPVILTPLDDDFWPMDYRVHAVTRDLSTEGVGLVCNTPIAAKFISVTFQHATGESVRVIAKILRTEEVGHYFRFGCKFIAE